MLLNDRSIGKHVRNENDVELADVIENRLG
jgi:hypothetical protein